MTPSGHFMVVAPIIAAELPRLRSLLMSMNFRPGCVNKNNALVPFAVFEELHFARVMILDDQTQQDIVVYGQQPFNFPPSLAFFGDFDGPRERFVEKLTRTCEPGLRDLFSYCADFRRDCNLVEWMNAKEHRPSTMYVNWIGRTMQQVREENALRNALAEHIDANYAKYDGRPALEIRQALVDFIGMAKEQGRLVLTPPAPTPLNWLVGNYLHMIGMPLIVLLLAPILIPALVIAFIRLRQMEARDPEITPRPAREYAQRLAQLEDHDTSNQFSALGTLKPGLLRRWTLAYSLWIVDWVTRHVYKRGRLTRVNTIHFARWVFLDGGRRLFFGSNYDGSLESYMDDFINKVAWGLNLVFTHGVGYPRTRALLFDGAKDEQKFKKYIRRHELPTEVWYNAHPGLTAVDLERNTRIREGLEKRTMNEEDARVWLSLI